MKFNLPQLGAMRLLVESSKVCASEAGDGPAVGGSGVEVRWLVVFDGFGGEEVVKVAKRDVVDT